MPEDGAAPEDKKGPPANVVRAEEHGDVVVAELDPPPRLTWSLLTSDSGI